MGRFSAMMRVRHLPPFVTKPEVSVGHVLWLDSRAPSLDPTAYKRSGLESQILNHPVLVIDLLDPSHDLVWVLVMTSTYNRNHPTVPIVYGTFLNGNYVLGECAGCRGKFAGGQSEEMAFHAGTDAKMNQHGHININTVFEIPAGFLRQERDETALGSYGIDSMSLSLVLEKARPAINTLESNSIALKKCPRPESKWWETLPAPIPDFDANAGYYSGTSGPGQIVAGQILEFCPDIAAPSYNLSPQERQLVGKLVFIVEICADTDQAMTCLVLPNSDAVDQLPFEKREYCVAFGGVDVSIDGMKPLFQITGGLNLATDGHDSFIDTNLCYLIAKRHLRRFPGADAYDTYRLSGVVCTAVETKLNNRQNGPSSGPQHILKPSQPGNSSTASQDSAIASSSTTTSDFNTGKSEVLFSTASLTSLAGPSDADADADADPGVIATPPSTETSVFSESYESALVICTLPQPMFPGISAESTILASSSASSSNSAQMFDLSLTPKTAPTSNRPSVDTTTIARLADANESAATDDIKEAGSKAAVARQELAVPSSISVKKKKKMMIPESSLTNPVIHPLKLPKQTWRVETSTSFHHFVPMKPVNALFLPVERMISRLQCQRAGVLAEKSRHALAVLREIGKKAKKGSAGSKQSGN